jgi:hypothetical protein
MIKREITYENLDEKEVTETFYFHLSKRRLVKLAREGYQDKLARIGSNAKGVEIMDAFTEIIGYAYGIRVEGEGENSSFKQSDELSENFLNSLAFDALLMSFITNPQSAIDFINNLMPKDVMALAENSDEDGEIEKPKYVTLPGNFEDDQSGLKNPRDKGGALFPWAFRAPNQGELQHMTKPQMADVMNRMSVGWTPPTVSSPV